MRPVTIDFAQRHIGWVTGWGVALFALGAMACGLGLWRHGTAGIALEKAQADAMRARAAVSARQPRPQTPPVKLGESEIVAINGAIARLNLPWQPLFRSVESATPKNVALLGLEPNGNRRILNISAEARTPEDMVGFVELVRTQPAFVGATLVKHEVNELDPHRPYRFLVEAQWQERL